MRQEASRDAEKGKSACARGRAGTGAQAYRRARGPARSLLVGLVRLYQCTLGAVLPNACRFTPTCSEYAIEAVRKHGALKGAWLALKRILRCNQLFKGGNDPVP